MSAGSRISDLKYKLATIELLNLAKNYYTYRELSQIVDLPEIVLSRYVKGHVLPTMDRALYINETLQKIMRLEAEIQQRLHFDESGFFDGSKLTSDTLLLERAVQNAINTFAGIIGVYALVSYSINSESEYLCPYILLITRNRLNIPPSSFS